MREKREPRVERKTLLLGSLECLVPQESNRHGLTSNKPRECGGLKGQDHTHRTVHRSPASRCLGEHASQGTAEAHRRVRDRIIGLLHGGRTGWGGGRGGGQCKLNVPPPDHCAEKLQRGSVRGWRKRVGVHEAPGHVLRLVGVPCLPAKQLNL